MSVIYIRVEGGEGNDVICFLQDGSLSLYMHESCSLSWPCVKTP